MKLFYGWIIVGAGIVITCLGMGTMMSLGIFLQPMSAATGWSRTSISTAALLNFLCMGPASFLWGALSDRFGTRAVVLLGGALLGLGLVAAHYSCRVAGAEATRATASCSELRPRRARVRRVARALHPAIRRHLLYLFRVLCGPFRADLPHGQLRDRLRRAGNGCGHRVRRGGCGVFERPRRRLARSPLHRREAHERLRPAPPGPPP